MFSQYMSSLIRQIAIKGPLQMNSIGMPCLLSQHVVRAFSADTKSKFLKGLKDTIKKNEDKDLELSDEEFDCMKTIRKLVAEIEGGKSIDTKNPDPYTVEGLIQKAQHYLDIQHLGEASETAFVAMKLALREYVKKIETTYSIKMIPQDSWDTRKYDKLIDLLECYIEPKLYDKIDHGWKAAKECHIYGWNINNLSSETIEKNHKIIFHSIEIIRKDLPVHKEVADVLSQELSKSNGNLVQK